MSVFVTIARPGSELRVVRLRSPHIRFGSDRFGMLTFNNPTQLWGSLVEHAGYAALIPADDKLLVSGSPCSPMAAIELQDGIACSRGETTLTFFLTSAAAESLSNSNEFMEALGSELELADLVTLRILLPGMTRTIPLFPNVSYSIGSSLTTSVYLPIAGVSEVHGTLTIRERFVRVDAREGTFDQVPHRNSTQTIPLPATLRLLPTNIPIELKLPCGDGA